VNVERPEVWLRLPDRDGEPGPLLHIHGHQVVNAKMEADTDLEVVGPPWGWPLRVGQLFRLELEFTGYEMVIAPPTEAVASHGTIQGQVEDDLPATRPRWEP
jgi:hypothetical protein